MAPRYAFHPMSADHLPMIRRWLATPDVVRAYAKAGFQSDRFVDTPDGPALLMVRKP
jgi:hypothetical protein